MHISWNGSIEDKRVLKTVIRKQLGNMKNHKAKTFLLSYLKIILTYNKLHNLKLEQSEIKDPLKLLGVGEEWPDFKKTW